MKILYPLAKRFIAGHDLESAKPVIQKMIDDGYEVSIDYIGENSKTYSEARRAYKQYKEIINEFKDHSIDISIKPTQLGLNVHPYLPYVFLHSLAKLASKYKHTIRLDMEDTSVTEVTRNLAISLYEKHENAGVAIQANLFRTEKDLDILIKKGVSVRLVKGAYKEEEKEAYQRPRDIKSAFFHYAAQLYSEKANKPAIATHDEELLDDIEFLIPNPDYYDYEFLYGIRRDLQKKYKDGGKIVRIYIPFGTQWLPYTVRRLREWKNLKFVIKNIFKEWFK
jgi:proline dehydrogenase